MFLFREEFIAMGKAQLIKSLLVLSVVFLINGCAPYSTVGIPPNPSDNEIGVAEDRYNNGTFSVTITGNGVEPLNGTTQQKFLLANRAAIVDAYRNLSERVQGLILEAHTRQGENMVSQDIILVETTSYLRGTRVLSVTNQDGISTATVKILLPKYKFYWLNDSVDMSNEVGFNTGYIVDHAVPVALHPISRNAVSVKHPIHEESYVGP